MARLGSHHVLSNPQVGCVITHDDRIIGEGYHRQYGGAHAEIEAIRSIQAKDKALLSEAHLYVSLEPCFHHGKTPPCVEAILKEGIKEVTICNLDPNPKTHGKSLSKLRAAGVKVHVGLMSAEGVELNRRFFVNQTESLPYVILKWAQSKDGYLGKKDQQIWLSNKLSNLQVHKWREEVDAILIGTNTAITDDPLLTNRRPQGRSPHRFVLDRFGRIPKNRKILCDDLPTTIITSLDKYSINRANKEVHMLSTEHWNVKNILRIIYKCGYSKLLIEGGAALHKSVITNELWHEARIIHTPIKLITGIKAPMLAGKVKRQYLLKSDRVLIINNLNNNVFRNYIG